jgi:hypothetical protein
MCRVSSALGVQFIASSTVIALHFYSTAAVAASFDPVAGWYQVDSDSSDEFGARARVCLL